VDIVYICRKGDNEELRYSLRSVAANLPYRNVWVVGGKPGWYKGDFIPVNPKADKYASARANLRAIVECDDISPEFVLMNDDFYVTRPVDHIPYYHGGDLMNKINTFERFATNSKYTRLLWDTLHILAYHGAPTTLDYALHVPMRMERNNLGPLLQYEASIRTLYGNLFRVGGTQIEDVKVHTQPRNGPPQHDYLNSVIPFLSTHDRTFHRVRRNFLASRFNKPSPFE
jgi:hypothetical protein